MTRIISLALGVAAVTAPLAAQTYRQGTITIDTPWTRQTAPGQSVGGGFMTIKNGAKAADRLLGGSTPAAQRVEVHTMSMEGGVMRMRQLTGGLAVPAGGNVALKPGGYHIMLIGLKVPLKLGQEVPLTLRFQRAGAVAVKLKVQPVGYGQGGEHGRH